MPLSNRYITFSCCQVHLGEVKEDGGTGKIKVAVKSLEMEASSVVR